MRSDKLHSDPPRPARWQWDRDSSTKWFANYRLPRLESVDSKAALTLLRIAVPVSLVATVLLGSLCIAERPTVGLYASVLILTAAIYLLRHLKRCYALPLPISNVVLVTPLVVLPFLIGYSHLLLPAFAVVVALTCCIVADAIAKEFVTAGATQINPEPADFFHNFPCEIFRRRFLAELHESDRIESLTFWCSDEERTALDVDDAMPGSFAVARSYTALRDASTRYRNTVICFIIAVAAIPFAARWFHLNYWTSQLYFLAACFVGYVITWLVGNPELENETQLDNDFAIRKWLSTNKQRTWVLIPLVVFTTPFVCRSAGYFPVPFVSRTEATEAYLLRHDLKFRDTDEFLSRAPENWILVSIDSLLNAPTESQRRTHAACLLLSFCVCCYVVRKFLDTALAILLQPAVPIFAHEYDYLKISLSLGVEDDLSEQEVQAASDLPPEEFHLFPI